MVWPARDIPLAWIICLGVNMTKTLVLFGAVTSQGHTRQVVDEALQGIPHTFVDLGAKRIGYFDPEFKNQGDDFLAVAQLLASHDRIIFATPIYWYAMSGPMKVFFDRLTDLTSHHKELGKSLAGKQVFLVVTGASAHLPPGFEFPFEHTSAFFKMTYGGCLFMHTGNHPECLDKNPENMNYFKKLLV